MNTATTRYPDAASDDDCRREPGPAERAALGVAETERLTETAAAWDPDEALMRAELAEATRAALLSLTPREERVMRLLYGFAGGEALPAEDVAILFGVTRERIRQIRSKALRRLKQPSRSRRLRAIGLLEGAGVRVGKFRPERRGSPQGSASCGTRYADGRLRWPDLSAYGIEMRLYLLPSGTRALIARNAADVPDAALPLPYRGVRHRCDTVGAALSACGFSRLDSGMWIRRDCRMPLDELRSALGRSRIVARRDGEVLVRVPPALLGNR